MEKNTTMAERIRLKRQENNWTQQQLADMLGVKRQTVCKWESGLVHNIDRFKVQEMARLFNCNPNWLMTFDDATNVKVTYEAPGKEPLVMRVSNEYADKPIIGTTALRIKLYETVLKIPPNCYQIAIDLLESLLKPD